MYKIYTFSILILKSIFETKIYFCIICINFSIPIIYTVNDLDINTPNISNISDPKTLERVTERSYVRDWIRLGLAPKNSSSTNIGQKNNNKEPFKIISLNSTYLMCRR